jgi:prepilin-type N-terminal cleavage/methylation domain-containing protein
MKDRIRSQRGYTLIEALIASAILAGLAAVLAPAIHASVRAASRIAQSGENAESIRIADGVLADLFSAAVDPGASGERRTFVGDAETLSFFVLFDMEAGPQTVALRIDGGRLSYAPPPGAGSETESDEIVLLDDAMAFRYYGASNARESAEWRPDWTSSSPPLLVSIERGGAGGSPPALTFRVSSRAPIHCLFDQVSRKCRD